MAREGGGAARSSRRWWAGLSSAVDGVLDVLFPPVCVECHGLVESGDTPHLCGRCRQRVTTVGPPHCTTCGYPFFGVVEAGRECPHCAALQPVFGEGRTAALLQGPLRRIVHALKYEGALHLLDDIEALARANGHFTEFLAGAVLVPVPLHPRKHRERGYNQAELLARTFARLAPGASVRNLLRRTSDTPSQTRLDRARRQENLKNAFALARRAPIDVAHRYVLVDDVFTTGATLNACASVLRRAGLTRIDVATLGHG